MAGRRRRAAGRAAPVAPLPPVLARAAILMVFALMILGNVVSATGSGLACPDWPLCHGRLVPPLRIDVLIEYGHRLTAAVTSVLLIAAIAIGLTPSRRARAGRIAVVLLVLLAAQIALGGITVLLKLPHLISTAHLVNALLILAGLLALSAPAEAPVPDPVRRLVAAGIVVLLVQLALGGYVRHSGAGLACPDFPLCSGEVFPDRWLALVHWVHRWMGVALLGLVLHLAIAARRTAAGAATALALVLALAQVTLGIATVLLRLAPPVRATHAAVGYALWGVLVWTALGSGAWRPAARRGQAPLRAAGEAARAS